MSFFLSSSIFMKSSSFLNVLMVILKPWSLEHCTQLDIFMSLIMRILSKFLKSSFCHCCQQLFAFSSFKMVKKVQLTFWSVIKTKAAESVLPASGALLLHDSKCWNHWLPPGLSSLSITFSPFIFPPSLPIIAQSHGGFPKTKWVKLITFKLAAATKWDGGFDRFCLFTEQS